MRKQKMLPILFVLFVACRLSAQPAERPVQVIVAPDHSGLLYQTGENVKFIVSVLRNGIPLENVEIRYDVSEDMMQPHQSKKLVLKKGTGVIEAGSMAKAGFLRCEVYTTWNDKNYKGMATVGFAPEKIQPAVKLPDDFVAFWDQAKAEAAKIPMDAKVTLVPDRCTGQVDVYHVSLQSYQYGTRVYGMLSIPKGEGPFPAILKVPGAGIRPYHGDIESSQRGYIVFEIGIHGIPVNLPDQVYANLAAGPLKDYPVFNLDNRDTYYYKRVYLGCVRALDFICSLPEYDGTNLFTYGGSQGGALAIVTAGLDTRVKGLVAYYPALCDLTGYLHGRAGGWPHMFKREEHNTPAKIHTAAYYDVVNFARQVHVPGFYTFGYNDMVCPPTSMYSAFNVIPGEKEFCIMENTAHYAYPEQREASWIWLEGQITP
ncbi:MAG: acetylxylan esterase [Tannerellaceae bacterium]|nr:acetylxylan esterase [Tannerellaceae bacterium]